MHNWQLTEELEIELNNGQTRKVGFPEDLPADVGLAIESKADIKLRVNSKGGQAREVENLGQIKADMHKALLMQMLDSREDVEFGYSDIKRDSAYDIWELYEDELELERAKN